MKEKRERNIKQKLLRAFIIVSIIASISGAVSVILMKVIDTQYSEALINYGFSQGDIGKLMANFCRIDGNVHDAVGYSNDVDVKSARENAESYATKMDGYFESVRATLETEEHVVLLDEAKENWNTYYKLAEEIMTEGAVTDAANKKAVQTRLVNELDPVYLQIYNTMVELMDSKVTKGAALSETLTTMVHIIMLAVVVIIAAGMAISMKLGNKIAKNISDPMGLCTARLIKLSKGDLQTAVDEVHTGDEVEQLADATKIIVDGLTAVIEDESRILGEMANSNFDVDTEAEQNYIGDFEPLLIAIRKITASLSDTIGKIGEVSEQVTLASSQMAEGANALAEGATDQASSIEELVATVTEVTDKVTESAKQAEEASQKAEQVGKLTNASKEDMSKMMGAMDKISETSKQIGDIINTIESIAAQTNLLSLNATIEAARAGEAGRGFAVVANEIRELADQSALAANNTRQLIEASLAEIQSGNTIVNETATALDTVIGGIDEIVGVVKDTQRSSSQQATAMEQINLGIDSINSVVQSNSATAEESSATSEELFAQAENLNNLVKEFKLKN